MLEFRIQIDEVEKPNTDVILSATAVSDDTGEEVKDLGEAHLSQDEYQQLWLEIARTVRDFGDDKGDGFRVDDTLY